MKKSMFVVGLALASVLGCQAPSGPSNEGPPRSTAEPTPGGGRVLAEQPQNSNLAKPPQESRRDNDSSIKPSPVTSQSAAKAEFATRHALFQPAGFEQLPQWQTQSFAEVLTAFKNGCTVLGKRPLWASSCVEAGKISGTDLASVRDFFEREFMPYQVLQKDRSDVGNLTGYFEPLLRGSRERKAPFVYPVYERPSDLLLLDAAEVEASATFGDKARYLVDGGEVKLIESSAGAVPVGPRVYRLALKDQQPGTRDRKYRVRVEGNQIVGYPSRQEIEGASKIAARPIAWVESREALYAMQVQGSGRILLQNGVVIRVAYAEQNGHAFIPRVGAAIDSAGLPKTRSMLITANESGAGRELVVKPGSKPVLKSAVRPSSKVAEVSPVNFSGAASPAGSSSARLDQEAIGAGFYGPRFEAIKDPSYVFFREINSTSEGPIGAMGVHLTPGRSIAVDPRVTPLGAPVMIARSKAPAGAGTDSSDSARLMVAQDTGGAIRGPVRADYFWGFGKSAAVQALRTNDQLKMWILLPKAFRPNALLAAAGGSRTRSLASPEAMECLIPDAEFCAE